MAVKIRLARIGKKHAPFYRIVAIDSRKKRDGQFLEDLGTYNTLQSTIITIRPERISHWLSQGAVLTESTKKIMKAYKKQSEKTAAAA
jgi:small subunit ribosomal protein S16